MAVVLPMASIRGPSSPVVVHTAHHPSLRGRAWTTGSTDYAHRRIPMAPPVPASSHTSPEEVDEMDEDDMDEDDEFDHPHHHSHHSMSHLTRDEQLSQAAAAASAAGGGGVHRTRRPRRRADEVERLYKCTWNGCEKSYGTLSHLNDHVRLQRHGDKREPHEFKEARRIWRQERKSRRLRDHAMHAAQQAAAAQQQQHQVQRNQHNHHLAPPATTVYPVHAHYAPSVAPESPYRHPQPPQQQLHHQNERDEEEEEEREREAYDRVPLAVASGGGGGNTRSGALLLLPGLRPSSSSSVLDSPNSPRMSIEDVQNDVRLPSIAELRLDLSLDEYEAQTALGTLSNAAAGSSRPHQQRSPYLPAHSIRHHHQRLRVDSAPKPLIAPPPPYDVYSQQQQQQQQQHQQQHDTSLSPEYSRFRLPTGPSSPSTSSVDFSVSSSAYTHHGYPSARSRASSHSQPRRASHSNNPSRPSTSTSSSTNSTNTSAYRLSTPMSYIPPSSSSSNNGAYPSQTFPFIPAPPPRGININISTSVNDASSDGTPTSTTTTTTMGGGGGAVGLTGMEPRRKRRKYEEIERRYQCGWNGCAKAYGTLNHLNDHVSLQNHGPKRRSSEF